MPRPLSAFLVFFMILAVLTGCRTMTGKTAGQNIDDTTITAAVKSKLVADRASNLTRVDVELAYE